MAKRSKSNKKIELSDLTDTELFARFNDGDRDAFDELYSRHDSRIEGLLKNEYALHSGVDVKDILQNTWEFILQSPSDFDPEIGTFSTWIEMNAKKIARKEFSSRKKRPSKLHDPSQVENRVAGELPELSKEEQALREIVSSFPKVQQDIVFAFLESLGPDGKSTGYSKVVAENHGLKESTIRRQKNRLIEEVRRQMRLRGLDYDCFVDNVDARKELIRKIAEVIKPNVLGDRDAEAIADNSLSIENQPLDLPEPQDLSLKPPQHVSSGFPALDDLLGGKGFVQGSSILIRGQPGTGKTTLALQISKHMMKEGHSFVFASVEDKPEILLNQVTHSFWKKSHSEFLDECEPPETCAPWHVKDLTNYFDQDATKEAEKKTFEQWCDEAGLSEKQRDILLRNPHIPDSLFEIEVLKDASKSAVRSTMREMEVDVLLHRLWNDLPIDETKPVILVVDSLNALINCAGMRFRKVPDRQMILTVMNSFRNWRRGRNGDVTVIFLVEEDARVVDAAASYLADSVIELRREAVEQTVYETGDRPRTFVQEMRFCKIQKGRGLAIQSRSCCYEFVAKQEDADAGIVFLPTYAASGVVSLFHENAPMLDVIRTLRMSDGPALFPQVVVQEFSRSALQRMFSVNRHRTRISLRHPMMLSNVDEYWLKQLKKYELLEPIPAKKLSMFAMSMEHSPGGGDSSPFVNELETEKANIIFGKNEKNEKVYFGVPQIANVGMLVYRKDILDEKKIKPPDTWEEVEKICDDLKKEDPDSTHKLYFELTTYDTFLSAALELGWGHGAFWKTVEENGRLRIEFEEGSHVAYLIAALMRIKHWIYQSKILPQRNSLDPEINPQQDWVFA